MGMLENDQRSSNLDMVGQEVVKSLQTSTW